MASLMEKNVRILKIVFLTGIFLAIFIFFTQIHPLVIFDTDDWFYISYKRHPFPLWGDWNPTRVFPEVLMPLCGDIAAFLVYPITGDYIRSFTIVNGAVVALFVVFYMHMFFELLYRKWRLTAFNTFVFSSIFLTLHFLVFRINTAGNEYLFYVTDTSCYYYYVIPALLNCSLVLYLLRNDVLKDGWNKLKAKTYARHIASNSILFLAFYFALFSNLYQSAILTAFIGSQLLLELTSFIKEKGNLKDFKELVKRNVLRLIFIFAWAIEQVFEINGGRANSIRNDSLMQSIINQFNIMLNKVRSMNKLFLLGAVTVFLLAFVIGAYHYHKKSPEEKIAWGGVNRVIALLSISDVLIIVYLLFLSSRAGDRGAVAWMGILFFVFLMLVLCCSYIFSKIHLLNLILPFICCILIFETRTSSRTFLDSKKGVNNSVCMVIDKDIISQFIEADKLGKDEIVLYVPEFNYNLPFWRLPINGGYSFSTTLYRHGVIDHPIMVTEVVSTKEKNEQLNLY